MKKKKKEEKEEEEEESNLKWFTKRVSCKSS